MDESRAAVERLEVVPPLSPLASSGPVRDTTPDQSDPPKSQEESAPLRTKTYSVMFLSNLPSKRMTGSDKCEEENDR